MLARCRDPRVVPLGVAAPEPSLGVEDFALLESNNLRNWSLFIVKVVMWLGIASLFVSGLFSKDVENLHSLDRHRPLIIRCGWCVMVLREMWLNSVHCE